MNQPRKKNGIKGAPSPWRGHLRLGLRLTEREKKVALNAVAPWIEPIKIIR